MKKDAQKKFNRSFESEKLKIIRIAPISDIESKSLTLVAIANTGERFFLGPLSSRRGLFLEKHRQSPVDSSLKAVSDINPTRVHEAFYNKGVFILANSVTEDSDTLLCSAFEPTDSIQTTSVRAFNRQSIATEFITSVDVQGKTLAIAEVLQFRDPALMSKKDSLNELAVQHICPPREFICLSNSGLTLMVKLRPIDKLVQLLQQTETEALSHFIKRYGDEEACCMLLMLACQQSYPTSSTSKETSYLSPQSRYIPDPQLAQLAEHYFFKKGGEPQLRETKSPQMVYDIGGSSIAVQYSALHNAIYLYFARLIRPLWKSKIVSFKITDSQASNIEVVATRIRKDILLFIEGYLASLKHFFDKHPSLCDDNYGITASQRVKRFDDKTRDARQEQQRSLNGLYQLITRCLQVIAFLQLLNETNLAAVVKK
jgi:nuclear pore complex protein Nup155